VNDSGKYEYLLV